MKVYLRYFLALVLPVCLLMSVRAQHTQSSHARIDSMQNLLSKQQDDTNKVMLLNALAFEYNTTSPYDGIKYGVQAKELAEELQWRAGIARANSSLGANYYSLSDFPNAYNYWLASLRINEEVGNKMGVARHLHNIGNIFFSQGDYTKALEYYTRGLEASKETGDKKFATNSYTAIGNVYSKQGEYTKALECHYKALGIDEGLNQEGSIAADKINIGYVYNELRDHEKALEILMQALQIKKEVEDKNGMARTYSMIGKVYLDVAGESATDSRDKVLSLERAVSYLDSAIAIDKKIGYLDNMRQSYEYRGTAEEKRNDYKEALYSYKQYYSIKDSVFSEGKQKEIFNLEKKAEIEEKKREKEREKEKEVRTEHIEMAGIGAFIVILISAILVLARKKVNTNIIELLGTISVLMTFEFTNLIISGQVEHFTHHDFSLTLLCLLVLAVFISRVHHKAEEWMKHKIGKRHAHLHAPIPAATPVDVPVENEPQ